MFSLCNSQNMLINFTTILLNVFAVSNNKEFSK